MREISKEEFKKSIIENVKNQYRRTIDEATPQQIFQAVSYAIKDVIIDDWIATQKQFDETGAKKVYYLSMEFLMGRALGNNIINLGAKKYARVRHTYLLAVSIATASILIGWAVCQLAPHLVLSLFGKENQTFTDFAVRCLRIYLGGIFCAGFQIVSTNYFQATGQPLKASLLSMLRQLILLIPMLLILPLFFGLNGLLYAGPCADIGSAVIVALFILPEMRKLNRKIAESQGHALAA